MALTLYEAHKRSRNPITRGSFLAIATSDEMLAMLSMNRISGMADVYKREKSLPTAEWVAPDHSSIAESSGVDDQVVAPLRLMVSDVDTYDFVEDQMSDEGSNVADQLDRKLKAAGRAIALAAIEGGFVTGAVISPALGGTTFALAGPHVDSDRMGPGDIRFVLSGTLMSYRGPGDRTYGPAVNVGANGTYTLFSDNPNKYIRVTIVAASLPAANTEVNITFTSSTNQPDGLKKALPIFHPQTIASGGTNGDALQFSTMHALIDQKVKTRSGQLAFVGNASLKAKFMNLLAAQGGSTAGEMAIPGFNGKVPTFRGIPFLQNDNIPSNEAKGSGTTLSSLFLIDFGPEGFGMSVGGVGEEGLISKLTPMEKRIMGLRIRQIGELENKEAQRSRVSFYGTFRLRSELAAARAAELITA